MSTRSTRRPQAQPLLSPLESLLLAQAAWQLGAGSNSWTAIAKLLSKHPLLSRPKPFFTAQSCHSMYEQLMKDAELHLSDSNDNPHAPMNLKLAEKYYRSRHTELRELILAEESKFKTILKEIEDIQAGLWDKKIQAELSGESEALTELPKEENLDKVQPSDEVFDGSELSGVSESAESASSQVKDETNIPIGKPVQNELQEVAVPLTAPQQDVTPTTANPPPSPSITITAIGSTETVVQDEDMASEEVLTSIPPISPSIPKDDVSVIPMAVDSIVELVEDTVDLQQNDDIRMEDQTLEVDRPLDTKAHVESVEQLQDQKQEEEEGTNQDDSTKEEEEASQSQQEDIEIDTDHGEGENRSSPKSSEQVEDVEELNRAPTPAAEAAVSEAEPVAEEDQSSASEEEPVVPARRSARRRKSSVASVPLPTTRKRLRSRARLSESEPQAVMDSENDDEEDVKDEETPQLDDDPSSPFDGAITRRREASSGKRKASFMDSVDSPIDKKRMREDSEPVDEDEPGPSSHNTRARITRHGTRTEEQVALKRFQNVIGMLHSQISQHRNGNIFHNPIKNSEAPDYHEIVKRPMDLKTIKTRFKDGLIANSLEFQRDIFLMFANSMMYNRPGSDVYAMAEDMMLESEGQITTFRQTEGLVKRGQRQT